MRNLLYCNVVGHQQPITSVCIKKDCELQTPCCLNCLIEMHRNHYSDVDFLKLDVAMDRCLKINNDFLQIKENINQMKKEWNKNIKQIEEIIELNCFYKETPNLSELDMMVQELKTKAIQNKTQVVIECISEQRNIILQSLTKVKNALKQKQNTICKITELQEFGIDEVEIKGFQTLRKEIVSYNQKTIGPQHKSNITSIELSKNDLFLASGDEEGIINLWSVLDEAIIKQYKSEHSVQCLLFSPNNEILAASSKNNILLFSLNVAESKPYICLYGHQGNISSLGMTNNSSYLISGSHDATLKIWNIKQAKQIQNFILADDIIDVDISINQKYVACCCWNGVARIFDSSYIQDVKLINTWKCNNLPHSTEFTPDSKSIIIADRFEINVWDIDSLHKQLKNGLQKKIIIRNNYSKLSPDGSILCYLDDSTITLMDYDSQEMIQQIPIAMHKRIQINHNSHHRKIIFSSNMENIITNNNKLTFILQRTRK